MLELIFNIYIYPTEFRLVLNQSGKCDYILNLIWFYKIWNRVIWVYHYKWHSVWFKVDFENCKTHHNTFNCEHHHNTFNCNIMTIRSTVNIITIRAIVNNIVMVVRLFGTILMTLWSDNPDRNALSIKCPLPWTIPEILTRLNVLIV